jgi:hypothetical protein
MFKSSCKTSYKIFINKFFLLINDKNNLKQKMINSIKKVLGYIKKCELVSKNIINYFVLYFITKMNFN